MAEAIVFQIDVQPITGQLASLGKSIEETKVRFEQLKKENGAYDEQTIATNAALKVMQKEYRSLETVLTNQSAAIGEVVKATSKNLDIKKIENNSIDTNRKLYNSLYGEYVRAGKEQREKMIPTLKAVSDELKKQEKAVGDTRRNVGNYAEGFVEAGKELSVFGLSLGGVKKGLDGAKSGFQAAGGGVKGFSAALATTGLPLIIAGINLLINAFQSFKPVADAVEDSVTALKAAFGALISGGSIKQAVADSLELLNTLRDLEDTQNAFNISVQRQRNEIEKLIIQSKDRTKTEKERTALLEDAEKREKELFNASVERLDREIAAEEKAFANKLKLSKGQLKLLEEGTSAAALNLRKQLESNKQYSEAELNTLQERIKERAALEGETNKDLEKIVNSRNKLIEKEQEENEKAAEKDRARLEKLRADREAYNRNLEKLLEDFTLSEREKISKGFDDRLKLIEGKNAQELALIETIRAAREKALQEYDQKILDAEYKKQAEALIAQQNFLTKSGEQLAANRELQLELQLLFNQTQEEVDLEFQESNFNSFSDFYKKKKSLYDKDAAAKVQADAIKTQSEKANLQAASSISKDVIGLVSQVAEAQGAGAEFAKALAFVQILTSQAIAIAGAVSGGVSSGAATGPGAIGAIPAFIATLVGSVTAVIGGAIGLLSRPVPKKGFAEGVIGLDGAGNETSDSIDAKLSRGESVMTAKATKQFAPILAEMELAVGNKPNIQLANKRFAVGYIPMGDGGYASRYAGAQQSNNIAMSDVVKEAVRNIPNPIVTVEEINRVNTSAENSVAVSEL